MDWISVKDRLPESDDYVLVHLKYGLVRVGQYRSGDWYYCAGLYMTEYACGRCAVTHWMPIPAPPEGA